MVKNQEDSIYLEANANYTIIVKSEGVRQISSYTLKRFEEKNTDFFRLNRKQLVNPRFISSYELNLTKPFVTLKNGKTILISIRRLESIKSLFQSKNNLDKSIL